MAVRVHHPLKQGLKHALEHVFEPTVFVRVHHPLQQGLRLLFADPFAILIPYECIIHHNKDKM
ncbi:hypothetical protein HMPREF0670_00061 [Prevotella sp. oral taxon 317 str. F0108]|nr:hypothetical protein HMPREF0670_00061 [Prevotella sp. oral taxon 317 str. F0108]